MMEMNASPDISYFHLADFPDQVVFRCEGYRASLSIRACGKRWRRAQVEEGERADSIAKCRGCHLGAQHAGEEFIYRNEYFGSGICARCRVGGCRMVGERICISCYNRQREFKAGKNAKGTAVTFHFEPRQIGVLVNYDKASVRYFEVREEFTNDLLELVFQIMRVTPGRVAFTSPLGRPAISTAELARAVGEKRSSYKGFGRPGPRRSTDAKLRAA